MSNFVKAVFAPPVIATARLPVPVPKEPTLADLTAAIQEAHAEAIDALAKGASAAIRAGLTLIAAKEYVRREHGHGAWEDYVVLDCRLSLRTAQHYMLLARQEPRLKQLLGAKGESQRRDPFASLTQAQACKLLGADRPKKRPKRKRA